MVVGVDKLCGMVGLQPHQVPSFLRSMEQNSIQYGILLFLLMPQLVARFSQSGAFEIYLNGGDDIEIEMFSKLREGGFPDKTILIQRLLAAGLQQQKR